MCKPQANTRKRKRKNCYMVCVWVTSVQFSHSVVSDSVTPWIAAHQASLSITNSQSLLKLRSIESVMPCSHLILCHPLLLLLSIFPSIRVFSKESALHTRWPKYWSFSFNISPSSEHPGLVPFRVGALRSSGEAMSGPKVIFCVLRLGLGQPTWGRSQ